MEAFAETFTQRNWESKPLQRLAARMPLLGLQQARSATLEPKTADLSYGVESTAENAQREETRR